MAFSWWLVNLPLWKQVTTSWCFSLSWNSIKAGGVFPSYLHHRDHLLFCRFGHPEKKPLLPITSGQSIATSHDRFPPNGGLVRKISYCQGNLGQITWMMVFQLDLLRIFFPMGWISPWVSPAFGDVYFFSKHLLEANLPWAPKTMKNKGFGHIKTRWFTIKTSKI